MDEVYNGIYQELADAVGPENTKKIYNMLHGQQIIFPQRLYAKDYVIDYVQNHYPDVGIKEMALKFNYSERHLRKLMTEISSNCK